MLRFNASRALIAIAALALTAACSDKRSELSQGGAPSTGPGRGGAGGTIELPTTSTASAMSFDGTVTIEVVDEAEEPIAGLDVALCSQICRVVTTDGAGQSIFERVEPATHTLEPISYPGDDMAAAALVYTRFFDLVPVGLDESVTFDRAFVMRQVASMGPLSGPQDLTLAGGLQVAFDSALFGTMDNPLPSPAAELHFGAIELAEEAWPRHGHDGFTLLRGWSLSVWGLQQIDAFDVTAPLGAAGPLVQGDDVVFLVADADYGADNGILFEEAAELSTDGMTVSTPDGGGLDRSTMWFIATRD